MSDLARLLQQYGYGEQANPLAQDGVAYDTSNVLAGMPKRNALSDALRAAMNAVPENKENSLSMLNMVRGGLDTAASWLDYQNKPQASDYKPSDVMGPLGAGIMGSAFAPKNALGMLGGRPPKTSDPAGLVVKAEARPLTSLDDRLRTLDADQIKAVANRISAVMPENADIDLMRRYVHQEVLRQVHAAAKSLSARTSAILGMGRPPPTSAEIAASNRASRASGEAKIHAAIDEILGLTK